LLPHHPSRQKGGEKEKDEPRTLGTVGERAWAPKRGLGGGSIRLGLVFKEKWGAKKGLDYGWTHEFQEFVEAIPERGGEPTILKRKGTEDSSRRPWTGKNILHG